MLDVILFLIAVAGGGATGGAVAETGATEATKGGAKAAEMAEAATTPAMAFEAEDQTPSGKFLTATEVRPILNATKPSWIAVREYNGQDLLYFTQILSWRCGLHQISYSVNGGPMTVWPMPECHAETAAPNAITGEDGLPYVAFAPGSVESVEIELLFDDLSTDTGSYPRAAVLMP